MDLPEQLYFRLDNETVHNVAILRDNKVKSDNKDDVDYDVAARELAFEGKGAASDRTLSAEEAAERDRQVCFQCPSGS